MKELNVTRSICQIVFFIICTSLESTLSHQNLSKKRCFFSEISKRKMGQPRKVKCRKVRNIAPTVKLKCQEMQFLRKKNSHSTRCSCNKIFAQETSHNLNHDNVHRKICSELWLARNTAVKGDTNKKCLSASPIDR